MGTTRQRQEQVTLSSALQTAIRYLRAQELEYRNPHGSASRRMDKNVRKALAATHAEEIRLLEAHLAKIAANA